MSGSDAAGKTAVTVRPATVDDDEFLRALYRYARSDEIAGLGWDEAQQDAFLRMQFEARARTYRTEFPGADDRVLVRDGAPIGRMMVARGDDEFRLVDIALLPEVRSRGIGTALIRELMAEAERCGKPVRLHVDATGRAMALYQRLGFRAVAGDGVNVGMEWRPVE